MIQMTPILIDTHDCAVAESVCALYRRIVERRAPIPNTDRAR